MVSFFFPLPDSHPLSTSIPGSLWSCALYCVSSFITLTVTLPPPWTFSCSIFLFFYKTSSSILICCAPFPPSLCVESLSQGYIGLNRLFPFFPFSSASKQSRISQMPTTTNIEISSSSSSSSLIELLHHTLCIKYPHLISNFSLYHLIHRKIQKLKSSVLSAVISYHCQSRSVRISYR